MKQVRSRVLAASAYTLILVVANMAILQALLQHALRNPTASHVLLVPFITLAVICQDRETIFQNSRPAWFSGAVVVISGIALTAAGWVAGGSVLVGDFLSLAVAGMVIAWIGGFLLFFGGAAARRALFPLSFLAFAIPMPVELLGWVTQLLKAGSAEVVAGLFTLTGTPYYRQEFTFTLPRFAIEIADECSGIRSSIALVLTTVLAGRSFLTSPWARALLIVATFPVAILKNGIRIVSLVLLSIHVDPEFLTGQLHHEGGFVFFLISVAMLAPVMAALMRHEASDFDRVRDTGKHGSVRD